ncbi:MAG TPA: class I SAM-dependent methyltransferase [Acidimicrobiales bacterium]|nr:class I SAM-dependent methyltransferase [Acidimicrobiales bacterium]
MTNQGQMAAEAWRRAEYTNEWVELDDRIDLLELPRAIAAAVVHHDRPTTALVVDVASGPGTFLSVFLDEFPTARGVWQDASDSMQAHAVERLARFDERVTFKPGDMTDLAGCGIPSGVDAIVTSRAAHHLDRDGLHAFYAEAASLLAPGGWLVNLDHIGPADVWDKRLRAVRPRFAGNAGTEKPHHHNYPLTSVDDHLAGFRAAGITDVEITWRAFYTCLFMGRKDS